MKKIVLNMVIGMCCLLPAKESFAGPKWDLGEESYVQLGFLGQISYEQQDNAADENDFYIRRARLILSGQIVDGVKFFVETDNDNAGKYGHSVSTDIQDIFADVRIAGSSHWVQGGLILLPFSLENFSSAGSLLGIDYNSEAIKLTNTFVWRDTGVVLHGDFGRKLAYRMGVFDGYDASGSNKNPDAGLRYTGHVNYCLLGEVETGWFYTQDKLGKGNFFSVGAGFDSQADATLDLSAARDSQAWVMDFQSNIQLGDTAYGPANVIVNGAWYDWDNAAFNGNTGFVETGMRVGKTMLTLKYSLQAHDGSDDVNDITFGLHHFLKGHNIRGGVEYRTGDRDDLILVGVQLLI